MKKIFHDNAKFYVIAFLCLFIFGGQPVEFGYESTFFHGYLIKKPVIKIGLGINLDEINVNASSGMNVYEVNSSYRLIAEDSDYVFLKGHKEKLTEKYVIQVSQSSRRENAELTAQELRSKILKRVYVKESLDDEIAGVFHVNIGDFLTRGEALSYIKKLSDLGIKDPWIIREEITNHEARPLWILVNDELINLELDTVLYFIPSNPQSYLSYNGKSYRGIFVFQVNPEGVTLINILNLEDYLKGVVPSELSPFSFREIEAHKAQAVAARTYAIKNMDLHRESGYDLGDSPSTQYYKGMSAEHPLSTTAVKQTEGEVLLYKGKLIDALYTSTCGGKTENAEDVFNGPALPYLRSVDCVYEKQKEWVLTSSSGVPQVLVSGKNIAPELGFLISSDVIPPGKKAEFYVAKAGIRDAQEWVENAASFLGIKGHPVVTDETDLTFETFASLIIEGFNWQGRVKNLLLESEKEFILKNIDELTDLSGNHMAYLIQAGIFPSSREIGSPHRQLTRGEIAYYLYKALRSCRDFGKLGYFRGSFENGIEVLDEGESAILALSPDALLMESSNGDSAYVTEMRLLGGEKVRWMEEDGTVQLLEVLYPATSNILDRSSSYHSWHVRRSKEMLEKRINQFYPIGGLVDINPLERGQSKRVAKLLVKGNDSEVIVKGLRIRRVLGLRETLFVVEREYDDQGNITFFNFNGRGWGHGVGLCQVGSYGMALTGADYKEILKKYYTGIKIGKIY